MVGLVADQDDVEAVLPRSGDRTLDVDGYAAVPAHRVDGDLHRADHPAAPGASEGGA